MNWKTLVPYGSPGALLPGLLFVAGCSAESYRRDADRDSYEILSRKGTEVGQQGWDDFTIEEQQERLRLQLLSELDEARHRDAERILLETVPPDAGNGGPGQDAASPGTVEEGEDATDQRSLEERLQDIERRYKADLTPLRATDPPQLALRVLSLRECLEISSTNSREYQARKEAVYLAALDLTLARYDFESQYGVGSTYTYTSDPGTGPTRDRRGTLDTDLSITRLLASGGLVVFDFTNSLVRRFTGFSFSDRTDFGSTLRLAFSQPLLRGFGRQVVQEPLVQAERNVLYALRDFERFRQEFAVQIASEYYDLARQIDAIENDRRSYLQFINAREQSEALADRGRRSQVQVDQALQSELRARDSWIRSLQSFEGALDRFKITLGLPMEAHISVDQGELEELVAAGLILVDLTEGEAIEIAVNGRPDFQNDLDRLDDRKRQAEVAADALQMAVDIQGGYVVGTERDSPFNFRGGDASWDAGITVDLPIERLRERNTYRETLIRVESQRRATSLAEDEIKRSIRNALRVLMQLQESHRIREQSVIVAERRVESTTRFLRMGRIEVRDALEATDALTQARNSLTSALVDFRIAVLGLYRDLGTLRITEDGFVFSLGEDAVED